MNQKSLSKLSAYAVYSRYNWLQPGCSDACNAFANFALYILSGSDKTLVASIGHNQYEQDSAE